MRSTLKTRRYVSVGNGIPLTNSTKNGNVANASSIAIEEHMYFHRPRIGPYFAYECFSVHTSKREKYSIANIVDVTASVL